MKATEVLSAVGSTIRVMFDPHEPHLNGHDRDYSPSYLHECARCGRSFRWPTRQMPYCPECSRQRFAEKRTREYARNLKRKRRKVEAKTGNEAGHTTCGRCGVDIPKRKRYCSMCRRVRASNSAARKQRLKRSITDYSPPSVGVNPETFRPTFAGGGS